MKNRQLINDIKNIKSELESFEVEINNSTDILISNKQNIINEIKSGSFDEMFKEIELREKSKKKETLLDKLFKLF